MPETRYHNSHIKIKRCNCSTDCQRWPTKHCNGKNYNCLTDEEKQAIGTRNSIARKEKAYNQAQARMLHIAQRAGNDDDVKLQLWFKLMMNINKPICENCGAEKQFLLLPEYLKLWRSCQAHLLPKRHFKSIQSHPLNGMVLGSGFSGLCYCHDDYDSNWEKASKMAIWSVTVERFKVLYPLIHHSEYKHIPNVLLETLINI